MAADTFDKMDLLVIGELNMDLILNNVVYFPEPGKEKIADDLNVTLGSSSAIFAANSSRLGLSVVFCGMVGLDNFGDAVIDQLRKYDVDTSLVTVSKQYKTGLSVIIRHAGSRAVVTFPGAMEHFSLAGIPDYAFTRARHLHISSLFLQPGIKNNLFEIVDRAKSHHMTVSIDTQWDPDEQWDIDFKKLVSCIDFFLPNENEFLSIARTQNIKEAIVKFRPHLAGGAVIVKQGPKGVTCFTADRVTTIPGYFNEHPEDTIGAGDSFNAGFIYRFLKGGSIEQCIKFGNMTGAVSTTKSGGTAAFTSFDDVLNIAKNNLSIKNLDDFTR